PACGHPGLPRECEVHVYRTTVAPHGEAERSVPGGQAVDADSTVDLQPLGRNPRTDDEGLVRLPLECQHAAEREDELGGDPRVRHVADVPRAPQIPPGDLRPLIPGWWAPVAQEELRQLEGALPPSETNQRSDDADLVRRVVAPVDLTPAPLAEVGQIFVEGPVDGGRRQCPRLAEQP